MAVHSDWNLGRKLFGGVDANPGLYVAGAIPSYRGSLSWSPQHWKSSDVALADLHLDYGRGLSCSTSTSVADEHPAILRILFRHLYTNFHEKMNLDK